VDAITLHITLSHLEHPGNYVRLLFIDNSSAFNTIRLDISEQKLLDVNLPPSTCAWIKDFLLNRPQCVKLGPHLCSPSHSAQAHYRAACSVHSCMPCTPTTVAPIIPQNKFVDDTTDIGLISESDESAYREEVQFLTGWCQANNLHLNTTKTKEATSRCLWKVKTILSDPSYPTYHMFDLLPSGGWYRSTKAHTVRMTNSFFPWAIRTLNMHKLH